MDGRMFEAKSRVDQLNQEIAEYFYPERANFTGDIGAGDEFASHLTDFYPSLVRRELADQIGSMVRPSDREWFKASVGNKNIMRDTKARAYLEFMTETTRAVLYSKESGFRRAAKEAENDWAAFGMGWVQVSYSQDRSNLLFKCHHPKNCAGEEGPDGRVNHIHRKCDMTARSMLHLFKDEGKLPQDVQQALKDKDTTKTFKVRHILIPLDKYEPHRKFPAWAKWADIYIAHDGAILQELPSATFDYVTPRWQTVSGNFYPFSPATIVALPQARLLQRMMETLIEAAEKRVNPPMVAVEDALTSPISLISGHVTYLDSEYDERLGAALRPIDLGKDVGLGQDMIQDSRAMLSEAFFLNKLAPLSNRDKEVTAFEASQLVQEYIRTALPLFEPIEDEWTGQILDLATQKIMRAGGFGPVDANGVPTDMPDNLLGQNIEFEFNNALKEARDRQVINGFNESAQLVAAASQLDPAVGVEVNTRDMFRDAFGSVPGGRTDWLNSNEQAQQQREAAQAQMQQQAEMQQVAEGAGVARQVGEAAQALGGAQ